MLFYVLNVLSKIKKETWNLQLKKDQVFIWVRFSNYKDALDNFRSHEESDCQDIGETFEYIVPQYRIMIVKTNQKAKNRMELHRKCSVERLQYFVRQGIAMKKNDEVNQSLDSLFTCIQYIFLS